MMVAPDKDTRDGNLRDLQTAADDWFKTEIKRLDNETRFLRTVLQARDFSDVALTNLAKSEKLVQDEIAAFFFVG